MWFDKGLIFGCTQCGKCCKQPGYVFLGEDDIARIADFLGLERDAVTARYLTDFDGEWVIEVDDQPGSACVFLVDDRCTVNAVKPAQCRSYPFWPEIVQTPASWREEAEHCPGVNAEGGRLYEARVIAELSQGEDGTD